MMRASIGKVANCGVRTGGFRNFATSSIKRAPIYELRTYSIKPENFSQFMALTEQNIALRTAHSPLMGYWTAELGAINQVVHIWEYQSYEERTRVRKQLQQSSEWIESYIKKALPFIQKQENVVLNAFPWCPLTLPKKAGGVYELRTYVAKPGKIPAWADIFSKGLPARSKFSSPVGIWFSEFGPLNGIHHLWHYESLDHRAAVRAEAVKSEEWMDTVRRTMECIENMHSKALIPASFSPLK